MRKEGFCGGEFKKGREREKEPIKGKKIVFF